MWSGSCEPKAVREALVELLAIIWRKWKAQQARKIKGIPHGDVFAHRLKVAGYEPTVARAIEKLCHGLSLQSIHASPDLLHFLEMCNELVLQMMRNETVFLTVEASEWRPPEEVTEDEE
ncbi:MAG: hypothetical protein QXG08_03110 [Candidatus Methanomethyliaceae archaeon]